MGYQEDRQAGARKSYAQRTQAEERRRREEEERRRREEEERRAREQRVAARQAEAQQRQSAQRSTAYGRRPDSLADTGIKPFKTNTAYGSRPDSLADTGLKRPTPAAPHKPAQKSANTFYTSAPDNGIIQPRFDSISAYNREIERQQERLGEIHRQQCQLMLKDDGAAVDALQKQFDAGEKEIAGLKTELGDIMGANVHGKPGNQQAADGSAG